MHKSTYVCKGTKVPPCMIDISVMHGLSSRVYRVLLFFYLGDDLNKSARVYSGLYNLLASGGTELWYGRMHFLSFASVKHFVTISCFSEFS